MDTIDRAAVIRQRKAQADAAKPQVLEALAQGAPVKQLAARFGLAHATVARWKKQSCHSH
jgi:transposase-like protein